MEPEIVIKTKIDNEEAEDDLDDLIDEAKSKGSDVGKGFAEGFGKGASKLKNKIENVISRAFTKMIGLGRGVVRVFGSITKALAGIVAGLGIISLVLGLLVAGGVILSGAFEKAFKDNEELKANVQYIIFAIKKALEPATNTVANILVGIVNLIIKAIQYTAVLIKMLTGHNIFEGATMDAFADSMKSADKSSKGIAKNMKEASKQTAKFDEMNILQDNSSAGGGGADAGGFTMPTLDLSNLTNAEDEVQKFIENWKTFGAEMKDTIENTPTEVWDNAFGNWGKMVKGVIRQVYGLWEVIDGVATIVSGVSDVIKGIFNKDKDQIIRGLIKIGDGFWEIIDGVIQGIIGFGEMVQGFIEGLIKTIWGWIKDGLKYAGEYIKNWYDEKKRKFDERVAKLKKAIQDLGNFAREFFKNLGTKIGDAIGNAFKGAINTVLSFIESKINGAINNINSLIRGLNKISPVKIGLISTISLPRLAKGGVINMPGRGVMVGSAIAGERGREGVIPLTDSQQMAMLGEAIGKYININATIPVYMGNRMVQREMRKIQAEDDFAFNR